MMANGSVDSEMGMVFKNGQMVPNTRVNGKTTELTEKENSYILTETYTMESGSTIKQTATVSIIISTAPCTRATGEMISSMVKEKNHGLMALFMRDTTWLAKSMEWVFIAGMTAANIQVNGMRIKSRDSELIVGWMDVNIKVNGSTIIWMEWESTPGLMVDATWVSTKTTKNMDTASISGPTEDYTWDNGCVENNMDWEYIKQPKPHSNMAFGKKVKE